MQQKAPCVGGFLLLANHKRVMLRFWLGEEEESQ